MTRPCNVFFRLAADTCRSGAEGSAAASTLFRCVGDWKMRVFLWILLIPAALGILFTVGILLYAVFLQIRFPLDRFYRTRSQQEDFIPYDRLPQRLIKYLLLIEDDAFFSHPGFSGAGIRYAFRINREKKQVVTGGSTITQQLVKNIYFGFRHSYLRKAVELVIALSAERSLGKRKILELYMNIIYFGNGVYGISDAGCVSLLRCGLLQYRHCRGVTFELFSVGSFVP